MVHECWACVSADEVARCEGCSTCMPLAERRCACAGKAGMECLRRIHACGRPAHAVAPTATPRPWSVLCAKITHAPAHSSRLGSPARAALREGALSEGARAPESLSRV